MKYLITGVLIGIVICFGAQTAQAAGAFSVSYSLTEGGYSLELTPVQSSKGISIRVNAPSGVRYEVTQRIVSPIQQKQNPGIELSRHLVMRSVSGSNRFGTIRIPAQDTPIRFDSVAYVSDPAGSADTFTLIYSLDRIEDIEPGDYTGRMSFTVTPIDSPASPISVFVEIRASISAHTPNTIAGITIATPTGSKSIYMNPAKESTRSADVIIEHISSLRQPLFVRQVLMHPLQSKEGYRLGNDAVKVTVRNANAFSTASLSTNEQLLATVYPAASSSHSILLTYSLKDIAAQKAGVYRGKVQYRVEQSGLPVKTELFDCEVELERLFELVVSPPDQSYTIEFRDVKPSQPLKRSEVVMQVRSNIGKPYQITQDIVSALVNKQGVAIPSTNFTIRTELVEGTGVVKFAQKEPVKTGNLVLFMSDPQGNPAKIKVVYELTYPEKVPAGDYGTNAAFSLLEM